MKLTFPKKILKSVSSNTDLATLKTILGEDFKPLTQSKVVSAIEYTFSVKSQNQKDFMAKADEASAKVEKEFGKRFVVSYITAVKQASAFVVILRTNLTVVK